MVTLRHGATPWSHDEQPCKPPQTIQLSDLTCRFAMMFGPTPRGVLARWFCAERLHAWGVSYATEVHDTLTLLVAELAANAVRHGYVPGRAFLLCLTVRDVTVRIEVTDARGERLPEPATDLPEPDHTGGRGLRLVAGLAASRVGFR